MPNIPNSASFKPSKKRKRSSIQSQSPSIRTPFTEARSPELPADILAANDTVGEPVNQPVDDRLLNSGVYKIYCQYKDPKEATEQIKKMKNCVGFRHPRYYFERGSFDHDLVELAMTKLRLVFNYQL